MSVDLLAVVLGLLGVGVGGLSGRALATGGYRIEEDTPADRPRSPLWAAGALGLLWWMLSANLLGRLPLVVPALLLLAWVAVVITWIDIDVHRIPVGIVVPAWLPMVPLIGIPAIVHDGGRGVLVGAALWGGIFLVLTLLGGMGAGDTRLAPLVGAVTGLLGAQWSGLALVLCFLVGGLWALALLIGRRAGLKTEIAFGPFMCLGAIAAALIR